MYWRFCKILHCLSRSIGAAKEAPSREAVVDRLRRELNISQISELLTEVDVEAKVSVKKVQTVDRSSEGAGSPCVSALLLQNLYKLLYKMRALLAQ